MEKQKERERERGGERGERGRATAYAAAVIEN